MKGKLFLNQTCFEQCQKILTFSLGTPIVMDEFGWSETEAVFNWSMIMSATGICSFASYLLISRLNKRFGEKNMCNL